MKAAILPNPTQKGKDSNRKALQPRTPATPRPDTPLPLNRIWYRNPWKWFFSIKVGLTLLVFLTIASIIGTAIDPLERAQATIFYTWWYKLLLLALAVNMTCATIQTIFQKILPSRAMRIHEQEAFYHSSQTSQTFTYNGTIEDVAAAFHRQGFRVRTVGCAGAARTGWIGRLGAPVAHAGLVLLLLAGFVSSWVAEEGLIQLPEGASTNTITLRTEPGKPGRDIPLGFNITVDDFATGYFPRTQIPSHFISTVTATKDGNTLYSGLVEVNSSPLIQGWYLHQTSYQEMKEATRYKITITGPALPKPLETEISPGQTLTLPGTPTRTLALDYGMTWTLTQAGKTLQTGSIYGTATTTAKLSLRADQFEPDFYVDDNRQVASRTDELRNPALRVTLITDGAPGAPQWLFGRDEMRSFSRGNGIFDMDLLEIQGTPDAPLFAVQIRETASNKVVGRVLLPIGKETAMTPAAPPNTPNTTPWKVDIGERTPAYATVISLTRNPAIPVIYLGCGLMMLGLLIGFFIPRREIWFLLDEGVGQIHIAAHYRHTLGEFDRNTHAALNRLNLTTA